MARTRNGGLAAVAALGVTQIVGYGTIYYGFALIVPHAAREFGIGQSGLFAAFSLGLLLAGFLAPRLGRTMDATGAGPVMAAGSLLAAVVLCGIGLAPGFLAFALLVVLLEFVALMVLYDAAFAFLAGMSGDGARRQITRLTLIAGFASTLFWPLTGWLAEMIGWRATYGVFAALNAAVAFPLHLWLWRRFRRSGADAPPATPVAPAFPLLPPGQASRAFVLLAMSFALSGLVVSATSVHMVANLQAAGVGAAATGVAMLMGPAQVAGRIAEAATGGRFHPLWTAIVSTAALPLGMILLLLPVPPLAAGIGFVVLTGLGQGLASIVRGTVPLALFGPHGFGAMLGRLAFVRTTVSAGAAFFFAISVEWMGFPKTQLAFAVCGVLALLPLPWLLASVPGRG